MSRPAADIALLDADARRARRLSRSLREHGLRAAWFADADALLLSKQPYGFRFFLVDLSLDAAGRLVRLLRRRSDAGVLAFGLADAQEGLRLALPAGADMFLPEPLDGQDVALAVQALRRRMEAGVESQAWEFDLRSRQLTGPSGQAVTLSEADGRLLARMASADGEVVPATSLSQALGRATAGPADNLMHAAIYRLRRRVEQATGKTLPLRSVAGAGYAFRGRLIVR